VDDRRRQPHKTAGYRRLHDRYGPARLGDALLAKWLSDDDALEKWAHLALDINRVNPSARRSPVYRFTEERAPRPHAYWVVLWYLSMGYQNKEVAEQMGLSVETIKRDVHYARKKLGLEGAPLPKVVAVAIREGVIP